MPLPSIPPSKLTPDQQLTRLLWWARVAVAAGCAAASAVFYGSLQVGRYVERMDRVVGEVRQLRAETRVHQDEITKLHERYSALRDRVGWQQ